MQQSHAILQNKVDEYEKGLKQLEKETKDELNLTMEEAKESNFVSYVKAMSSLLIICCDDINAKILFGKNDICNHAIGENWDKKIIEDVKIESNCNKGDFNVVVNAHIGKFGNCKSAKISSSGVIFDQIDEKKDGCKF